MEQTPNVSFFEKYQTFISIIIAGLLIAAGIIVAKVVPPRSANTGAEKVLDQATVEKQLVNIAGDLGLNKGVFKTCLDNHTYQSLVASDVALAQKSGVQGTPTFFILTRSFNSDGTVGSTKQIEVLGARDQATFLNAITTGKAPSDQPAQTPGEKIVLSPTDHYQGPTNAKIVIVEYSDIECPYCKAVKPTIDALLKAHPEYGFVFRQSPIAQLHPWAEYKAEGSECAANEGGAKAFWSYLDETMK